MQRDKTREGQTEFCSPPSLTFLISVQLLCPNKFEMHDILYWILVYECEMHFIQKLSCFSLKLLISTSSLYG